MALPLLNSFDCAQADATAISAANSGGGTGNNAWDVVTIGGTSTAVYDSTHAHSGTRAAKLTPDTASGTIDIRWSTSPGTFTEAWGRMYLYRTANPPVGGAVRVLRLFNGATVAGFILVQATGVIGVSDSTSTNTAGAVAMTLSQWVRLEWHYLAGTTTGLFEAKLFNTTDSVTADETITRSNVNMLTQATEARFGYQSGTLAQSSWWVDDVQVNGTGYPGPLVAAAVSAPLVYGQAVKRAAYY